jgi:hypothetical protein
MTVQLPTILIFLLLHIEAQSFSDNGIALFVCHLAKFFNLMP